MEVVKKERFEEEEEDQGGLLMGEEELMDVLGMRDIFSLEKNIFHNGSSSFNQTTAAGELLCPPLPPPCSISSTSSTSPPSNSCSVISCSTTTSAAAATQMLCFGNINTIPQISSDSSSISTLSSSSPPSTTTRTKTSRNSKKSETGDGRRAAGGGNGCGSGGNNSNKKQRTTGTSAGIKVRKEKLGDRITALQQLVSPFGKSDTASVLHEALGYIRFLHDQVQVLSSPYLQNLPHHLHGGDLRSRGLCLVPMSCTEHAVADSSNGADLWSPTTMGTDGNAAVTDNQNTRN